MKAIVGLGNPGPRYQGTRHNIGFAVVDELARRQGVEFESAPVDALIAKVRSFACAGGTEAPVLLVKPLTFMNESGQAVGGLLRYFKIEPEELVMATSISAQRANRAGSGGLRGQSLEDT